MATNWSKYYERLRVCRSIPKKSLSLLNSDKPISQPDREQRPAPGTPEDDQFQKDRKQYGTHTAEEIYKDSLADAFDERPNGNKGKGT